MLRISRAIRFGLIAGLALAGGCGTPEGPAAHLEVSNNKDDFSYLAQSFDRLVTDSQRYTWQHTTTVAKVDEQSNLTDGTVSVVIRDANGTQLYSSETKGMATFSTNAGTIGDWTITVVLKRVKGDIVFSVTKLDGT